MPRKDLTLSEKIALLDKIKSHAPNTSHRALEMITGVPKSTISRFLKNEQKLREEWALRGNPQGAYRKRKRGGKEPEVEDALNQWLAKVTSRVAPAPAVRITGPILKLKAEDFAKKLGHQDFKATDGWLSRWKSRHSIKFRKGHGENGESVEKWRCSKLPELLQQFSEDDIYNADETGLFYRATPDGSLCYRHETLVDSQEAMDRVTVLCCSNMSGSDKRKLLVIGRRTMPRCFLGLRMDALPVSYQANKNAWMTSEIFSRWLKEWDVQLQHQSRKILLLVDNCPAHTQVDCLKNIQVEFLPTSTTSILQPMEMGIIENLKTSYRSRLVRYIQDAVEENHLHLSSTAADVSRKINILQAIQFLSDSWREMKGNIIHNCFVLCGWKNSEYSEAPNATNIPDESELQIVENYEEFLAIDNNVECYNENDDYDDEIIEGITAKREEAPEHQDSDDADVEDVKPVTHRDARKFIDGLRLYFMQIGNEGAPLSSLDDCADFVHCLSMENSRQLQDDYKANLTPFLDVYFPS